MGLGKPGWVAYIHGSHVDMSDFPKAKQHCTFISSVVVLVIVVVSGVMLAIAVISVNIASFISIAWEIDRAIHTRPAQIPVD